MKSVRQLALGSMFLFQVAFGPAFATPLATANITGPAYDYINFPIENGVAHEDPFHVSGTLFIREPDAHIYALDEHYLYEHSLIVAFDFLYSFIGDQGEFVSDQLFRVQFDSYRDYVDVGRVPYGGLAYSYAFDGNQIARRFNEKYRGLTDNLWTIYGFRADVRHIYQPDTERLPEPGTVFLVGIAALAGMTLRHRLPAPGISS